MCLNQSMRLVAIATKWFEEAQRALERRDYAAFSVAIEAHRMAAAAHRNLLQTSGADESG